MVGVVLLLSASAWVRADDPPSLDELREYARRLREQADELEEAARAIELQRGASRFGHHLRLKAADARKAADQIEREPDTPE